MIKLIKKLLGNLNWFPNKGSNLKSHHSFSNSLKNKDSYQDQEALLKSRYQKLKHFRDSLRTSYNKISLKEKSLLEKEELLHNVYKRLKENQSKLLTQKEKQKEEQLLWEQKLEKVQIEIAQLNQVNIQYQAEIVELSDELKQIQVEFENQKLLIEKLKNTSSISKKNIDRTQEIENLKLLIRDLQTDKFSLLRRVNQLDYDKTELLSTVGNLEEKLQTFLKEIEPKKNIKEYNSESTTEESKSPVPKPITKDNNKTDDIVKDKEDEKIGRSIEPKNIPGRRNFDKKEKNGESIVDRKYTPKARLICWKDEWDWKICVEIPEDIVEANNLKVLQNNEELKKVENSENYFQLKNVVKPVIIKTSKGYSQEINFNKIEMLLFKLSASNNKEGILVKQTNFGHYVAIVPNSWNLDEDKGISSISEPEKVMLSDFQVYHFYIEKNTNAKIVFKNFNGEEKIAQKSNKFYNLQGNVLENNSDTQGVLFGDKLPTVLVKDDPSKSKIVLIIIGEEGKDQRNWRKEIFQSEGFDQLDLSQRFPDIKSGWYFLRFYNEDDELIDSCDFRFISSLKQISLPAKQYVPGENGHSLVKFELLHDDEFIISSADYQSPDFDINETANGVKNILVVPNPILDQIKLDVKSKLGRPVDLFLSINQIWWKLEDANAFGLGNDKKILLSKEDFLNYPKVLLIKFPFSLRITQIKFGFQNRELRTYSKKVDSSVVKISLQDFSDSESELNSFGRFNLNCEFSTNDETIKFTPCQLVSIAKCSYCIDFTSDNLNELLSHTLENHYEIFFCKPKYEDVQKILPHLPDKIYKCVFCPEDNPTFVESIRNNSTELILRHIERIHPNENQRFLIEDDINVIKEYLMLEIPEYRLCKICRVCIEEHNLKNHLIEKHSQEIYRELK